VGPEFDSRIQGGVLSDGLGGFLSALFTVTPLSIFAQVFRYLNHFFSTLPDVLWDRTTESLRLRAVPTARLAGGAALFSFYSVCWARFQESSSPVSPVRHDQGPMLMRTLVPNPVLGGVTTFLFASVVTSGLRVLAYMRFTRRDRFVLAAALSFGFGNILAPTVFTHLFDGVKSSNKGLQGFLSSITIVLSTPCESSVHLMSE
jgi:hypothetical protein